MLIGRRRRKLKTDKTSLIKGAVRWSESVSCFKDIRSIYLCCMVKNLVCSICFDDKLFVKHSIATKFGKLI